MQEANPIQLFQINRVWSCAGAGPPDSPLCLPLPGYDSIRFSLWVKNGPETGLCTCSRKRYRGGCSLDVERTWERVKFKDFVLVVEELNEDIYTFAM